MCHSFSVCVCVCVRVCVFIKANRDSTCFDDKFQTSMKYRKVAMRQKDLPNAAHVHEMFAGATKNTLNDAPLPAKPLLGRLGGSFVVIALCYISTTSSARERVPCVPFSIIYIESYEKLGSTIKERNGLYYIVWVMGGEKPLSLLY